MRELDHDTFVRLLGEVMDDAYSKPSQLLSVAGIYEVMSEELNNAVLDHWKDSEDERMEDEANMGRL